MYALPAAHRIAAEVIDQSDALLRAPAGTWTVAPTPDASFAFLPERDLRPLHAADQAGAGSDTVAPPLRYRVRVVVQHERSGAVNSVLLAVLEQNTNDRLRQAYLFHGQPFQNTPALPPPAAACLRPGPDPALPRHSTQAFSGPYVQRGPVVDSGALQSGLAWIRRRYSAMLFEGPGALSAAQQQHLSADVVVTAGWVDPQTNERLGLTIDHPGQWGVALDLAPFHTHLGGTLYLALATAAAEFLVELRRVNPSQAFQDTRVRLVSQGKELWCWSVGAGGIVSAAGSDFAAVVGGTPGVEAAAAAAGAAALAAVPPAQATRVETHVVVAAAEKAVVVSLRFLPDPITAPLTAPAVTPYPAPPALASQMSDLIVLAVEDPGVAQENRLPIDAAARTIERNLRQQFPGDDVRIVELGNPVSLLGELGTYRGSTPRRWRHVFLLSHAWGYGLQLTHGNVISGNNASDDLALREIYGRRYAIGQQDLVQFRTSQFRASNLLRLPAEMFDRLRQGFSACEGLFVLGCSSGTAAKGLSAVFARELGVTVWAAGDFTKFYDYRVANQWTVTLDVTRNSPAAFARYGQPFMLLPAPLGKDRIKSIEGDPLDALDIYRRLFVRFTPEGPEPAP